MLLLMIILVSFVIAGIASLIYIAVSTKMPPLFPSSDEDREGPLSARWVDWLLDNFMNPDTGKCFIYSHFVPESTKWARRKKRISSNRSAYTNK